MKTNLYDKHMEDVTKKLFMNGLLVYVKGNLNFVFFWMRKVILRETIHFTYLKTKKNIKL